MKSKSQRDSVMDRVEDLKKQISILSEEIEKDRKENGDDSAVLNELLDKKDFLEQNIIELLESMNSTNHSIGLKFIIDMNGSTREFKIVHPTEADSQAGYISPDSPLAMALQGASKGDSVVFETPAGKQNIKVLRVDS